MPALAAPAAIDAVVIALLGALLIWASRPLWRPLWEAFTQVPVVGYWIASRVEVLVTSAVNAGVGWARAGIAPLALLIHEVHVGLFFYWPAVTGSVQSLYSALLRVYTVTLPALEARVVGYAGQLYQQALAYAQALYQAALAFAQQLYQQALAYAGQLYAQAIQHAEQLYAQALHYTDARIDAETAWVQLIEGQLIGYVNQVARGLQGEITEEGQVLRKWIEDLEAGTVRWVERGLADAEAYARALAEVQAAALATGLSWAVVQALAAVATLERRGCMKYCEPLGNLGAMLQQVEDAGLVALIMGLTAEALVDPRGTAKTIDELIGPTVRGLTNDLAAGFGLGRVA